MHRTTGSVRIPAMTVIQISPFMGVAERRVLSLLRDREPHTADELRSIVHFPGEWIRALREDGYPVEERNGTFRLSDPGLAP
jgi:hypothetical protein